MVDYPSSASRSSNYSGLTVVLCFFCAPLFLGLSGRDLQSDEAIYSYAVDRILETGDWLTPRAIPYDVPFVEKPPLKFWIVAGAMAAGLLPHDEFGLRFTDALFGAVAFVYVFWLGQRLAGALAGAVAVLVLFTLETLVFEHGLRSNNMDAALVLSFCGGIYHFAQWAEGRDNRYSMVHALAFAGYFTLGFMTKFVAALFLPIVCAAAFAWRRDALVLLRSRWREWNIPLSLVFAAIAPWFVYQTVLMGGTLWKTMFAVHVFERFTGALDVRHLEPWHFYYSSLWQALILAGSHWIAAAGMCVLALKAWTGRDWRWRLLLVWWVLPFAVISVGTSKIFHYAYPFLPPIALAAGGAAAAVFDGLEPKVSRALRAARLPQVGPSSVAALLSKVPPRARRLLLAAAVFALIVSVWTALAGPLRWRAFGVPILTNAGVVRPLIAGVVFLWLGGHLRAALSTGVAIATVAIILPSMAYPLSVQRTMDVRHPLRNFRDCAVSLQTSTPEVDVYLPYDELSNHSYYYYLRRVGPWREHERPQIDELQGRLSNGEGYAVALLPRSDYWMLKRDIALPAGIAISSGDPIVILTSPRLDPCSRAAIGSGGSEVGDVYTPRMGL